MKKSFFLLCLSTNEIKFFFYKKKFCGICKNIAQKSYIDIQQCYNYECTARMKNLLINLSVTRRLFKSYWGPIFLN